MEPTDVEPRAEAAGAARGLATIASTRPGNTAENLATLLAELGGD